MTVETTSLRHCPASSPAASPPPRAARRDRGLECSNPVVKRGLALTPVQVRHQLHRDAAEPGRRAGPCLHRRQRAAEPHGTEMGQGRTPRWRRSSPTSSACRTAGARERERHARVPNASATAASSGTDPTAAPYRSTPRARSRPARGHRRLDGCSASGTRTGQRPRLGRCRGGLRQPHPALERRLHRTPPRIHYDKTTLTGRPFYFLPRRGLQPGRARHADRRAPRAGGRHLTTSDAA